MMATIERRRNRFRLIFYHLGRRYAASLKTTNQREADAIAGDVLRGWHVFRHSFCSNCAAAGIDQRLIDAWVGHTTEEMRRRYRHLLPNQERQAIQTVFGPTAPSSPTNMAAAEKRPDSATGEAS